MSDVDWLDSDVSDRDSERQMRDREFNKLREEFLKSGYRDTVSDTREKYLQEGFDEGFYAGGQLSFRASQLQGYTQIVLSAASEGNGLTSLRSLSEEVDDLVKDIRAITKIDEIDALDKKLRDIYVRVAAELATLKLSLPPLRTFPRPERRADDTQALASNSNEPDMDW